MILPLVLKKHSAPSKSSISGGVAGAVVKLQTGTCQKNWFSLALVYDRRCHHKSLDPSPFCRNTEFMKTNMKRNMKTTVKITVKVLSLAFSIVYLFSTSTSALPTPKGVEAGKIDWPSDKADRGQSPLVFDIPVTYNYQVSRWIHYYQTNGHRMFKRWLERSYKYFPMIKRELENQNIPRDLAYMVMIESGFTAQAVSHADAVGPWQFIESTGRHYGLNTSWWLDERRDFRKSTAAAIRYMNDLYNEFESWYLVAASYNMGENGLRRIIQKYRTKDYWRLIELKALPKETAEYVPKLLAAMLVAKAPSLYGFRGLQNLEPIRYQVINAPGGTRLYELADFLGITHQAMKDLNPELKVGFIPRDVSHHPIHVPYGALRLTKQFIAKRIGHVAME